MAKRTMVSVLYICLTILLLVLVPTTHFVVAQTQESSTHVVHVSVASIEYDEDIEDVQYYKVRGKVIDIVRQPSSNDIKKGDTITFKTYVTSGDDSNGTKDPIDILEDDCVKVFLIVNGGSFEVGAEDESIEILPDSVCATVVAPIATPVAPTVPVPAPVPAPRLPVRNPPVPVPVPQQQPVRSSPQASSTNVIIQVVTVLVTSAPANIFFPQPTVAPVPVPPVPVPVPVLVPVPVPAASSAVVTIPSHTTTITFIVSTTIIGFIVKVSLFL